MSKTSLKLGLTAAVSLAAIATSLPAQEDDGILSRYRAQGGMLPVEAGPPPAGNIGSRAGSQEDPARAMTNRLATGREAPDAKIEGFNEAVRDAFPMTPEMIRRYRQIVQEHERAAQERPEPQQETSTTLVSLEPGEPAPVVKVSPDIASVIGFYDATGEAWPIEQFVMGNDERFNAVSLGESANNLVLSPSSRIGFTNLVVKLRGQDKPAIIRINISEDVVDDRYDVQVMKLGPNAQRNNASGGMTETVTEAGNSLLLAGITGVDLPRSAEPVNVAGVDARGWLVGEDLLLRSRHALLSPSWTESMSGPDGVRVYKINPASVALFSVGGQIVRADIQLP